MTWPYPRLIPRRARHQNRGAPHLRVVDRPARRPRAGPRLAAGLLALFLALFSNGFAHAVLVSGQERLDGLNQQVEEQQALNRRLHLQAASLESPERIVEAAKGLGLVPADKITWLTPSQQDGSVASTTDGGSPSDGGTEELASTTGDGGPSTADR